MDKINIRTISFRDLLRPIFRQKLVIVITTLLVVTGVYISLLFRTPLYEAKILMQIKGVGITEAQTYGPLGPFRIHLTQMAIVKSNPVIKRAVEVLELEKRPLDYEKKYSSALKKIFISYKAAKEKEQLAQLSQKERDDYLLWKAMISLKNNISTNLKPNTDLFEIIVQDYDPSEAIEIANVVSRSYTIFDLQQQLAELTFKYGKYHPIIQQLQDNISIMTNNLNGKELSDLEAIGTASVKIIEQASTNYIPIDKPKSVIMSVGIVMGLFVGLALAILFDLFNQSIKSPQEFIEVLNIPVIGTIPKIKLQENLLIQNLDNNTVYTEFYSDLADQLFIFMKVQKLKTLIFVSSASNFNNVAITSNLGFYFSQNLNLNTLIIDANITRPSFNKILKVKAAPGLADMLENGNLDIDGVIQKVNNKLQVLSTGNISDNTTSLLNEEKVKPILTKIQNQSDIIFIDCTFIKKVSDIALLSSLVDGVVVIVDEGKDHIQSTKNILNIFLHNKANVIGGIINNRTFPIPSWLYKWL